MGWSDGYKVIQVWGSACGELLGGGDAGDGDHEDAADATAERVMEEGCFNCGSTDEPDVFAE